MKISLFLMVFIITTFLFSVSAFAEGEYISGNTVYINDDKVYLSAYPHTLKESGYVYFNLTSKQYSGNIDFLFGFNSFQCKPISAEVLIADNWIDISDRFNSINYNYDGLNKWYYLNEISIYSNTNYTLRAYLQINEISTGGKYGVAVKPSSETISQSINNGHFYYLDPWWNGSWLYRKTITLTGNTSGAQTDYQLLLNVTYDSDMQPDFDDLRFANDTHQIDAWLEFNTTDYALVWVEFPTTPANGVDQDYYMYYGNITILNNWDGNSTFIQYHGATSSEFIDTLNVPPSYIVYEAKCRRTSDPYNIRWGLANNLVYSVDDGIVITPTGGRKYMATSNEGATSNTYEVPGFTLNQWYKILFTTDGSTFHAYVDNNEISTGLTTNLPIGENLGLIMEFYDGNGEQEWSFVRKYAVNFPTYIFGNEEKSSYIPPNPTNLQNTTSNFLINHTWQSGAGNVTDSYNISVNSVWQNGTINAYWNVTYPYSNNSWQNITIWAYNNSGIGTLSTDSISQNTQLLFTNLPTNLQKTYDHTWINWTWGESFLGTHIIDSYNVSINSTWNNSTINHFYNHTNLTYELTSSIVVHSYNNTQGLSVYYVSDSYTFPIHNKMVKAIEQLVTPIQIIADKFFNIIPFIISIILFAGFGLAIMTMTRRLKKW